MVVTARQASVAWFFSWLASSACSSGLTTREVFVGHEVEHIDRRWAVEVDDEGRAIPFPLTPAAGWQRKQQRDRCGEASEPHDGVVTVGFRRSDELALVVEEHAPVEAVPRRTRELRRRVLRQIGHANDRTVDPIDGAVDLAGCDYVGDAFGDLVDQGVEPGELLEVLTLHWSGLDPTDEAYHGVAFPAEVVRTATRDRATVVASLAAWAEDPSMDLANRLRAVVMLREVDPSGAWRQGRELPPMVEAAWRAEAPSACSRRFHESAPW